MYNNFNMFNNPIFPQGQPQGYPQGYPHPPKIHKPTKKEIRDYIINQLNPSEVINVDDFETLNTRHICKNSKVVSILSKQVYSVPSDIGFVNVEIIFCNACRKLIINKSSLDLV